jgi:hypothetical protein
MSDFDNIPFDPASRIQDLASTLNTISYEIAELSRIKEELEIQLNELIQHSDEGQKTYTYGKFDITMTSGFNYSLNKEEYELMKNKLPACFNPVKERVAFDIDKKVIRDAKKYASQEELLLLSTLVVEKPKKLHVRISAGV